MILYIFLGIVLSIAIVVLCILFYTLSQEGKNKEEKAVPVTDLDLLKKEISSGPPQPPMPVVPSQGPETIPAFVPKEPSPAQEALQRVAELEEELRIIKQKTEEQSDITREMILTLNKENQSLKSKQADLEEAQGKLTVWENEVSGLKTENADLKAQLESSNAKVHLLEEEKAQVKAAVTEAPATEASATEAPKPVPDVTLSPELESLKYELVKAKAQSSGLERVCSNYKNQVEDFLKNVNALQAANDQLLQDKNKLDKMVEEVKSQNEELAQKDQLSQFELEKNRERLLVLERDYEELKSRVQLNNQQ